MSKRLLLLVLFVLAALLLIDLNEESIFVVGAFTTWFFLFDAVAGAVEGLVYKELTEEFVLLFAILTQLKGSFLQLGSLLSFLQRGTAVIVDAGLNFHKLLAVSSLVQLLGYKEVLLYGDVMNIVNRTAVSLMVEIAELDLTLQSIVRI